MLEYHLRMIKGTGTEAAVAAKASRPKTMRVASGLWLALQVVFMVLGVGGFLEAASGVSSGDPLILLMAPVALVIGGVFLVLRRMLNRGKDVRIALSVLGGLPAVAALVFVLPLGVILLLVVGPAIALMFRPASNDWIKSIRR